MITFGSLFAGIGGFDNGFENAGMECLWKVEKDKHCRMVLKYHDKGAEVFEDVKTVGKRNLRPVDVICAGVPCQDVSVAGKRKGLAGDRTGLFFEFERIVSELQPEWFVFENVPGLLSSNEQRDFATILGRLGECGYLQAYRVLNSQYWGVAQRRRRVFIVGHLGGTGAIQVLFEPEGLPWNPQKGGKKRPGITQAVTGRLGSGGPDDNKAQGGFYVSEIAAPISAKTKGRTYGDEELNGNLITGTLPADYYKCGGNGMGEMENGIIAATATGAGYWSQGKPRLRAHQGGQHENIITHALPSRADGSEDGTGRGTPIIPTGDTIHGTDKTKKVASETDKAGCIRAKPPGRQENSSTTVIAVSNRGHDTGDITETIRSDPHGANPCVAFTERTRKDGRNFESQDELSYAVTNPGSGGRTHSRSIAGPFGVRRLTPKECERLQGFPDDFTRYGIDETGKTLEMSDTQRYRQLGNAVTVSVSQWIGKRIVRPPE